MEITFKACKLTGMVNLKPTMYSYQVTVKKDYQQRHLAGVNFCLTKFRKNLLILMTFLPECQLGLWKLLSMLVYWQVWSI